MAKIYKTSDRIKVKVDTITVEIAPLSTQSKKQLQSHMLKASQGNMDAAMEAVFLAVKFAVKSATGIEDADGKQYELEFDGNDLSDDCVNDLLNMEESDKLSAVCMSFLSKVPTVVVDANGKPIDGVKILPRGKSSGK